QTGDSDIDSSAVTDSSSVSDAPVDAKPLRPCANGDPKVVWCDDFNASSSITGWTQKIETNGTATFDSIGGQSGSGALRVELGQDAFYKSHNVGLWQTIEGGFADKTKLTLRCNVKIENIGVEAGDTLYYLALAAFRFNGTYYGVARYNAGSAGC